MSGPNAALSLPPGDRDDAPVVAASQPGACAADAGREPHAAAGPDIDELSSRLRLVLDGAQLALAELTMARKAPQDRATARAAAWRLNEALMADPRSLATQLRKAVVNAADNAAEGA
jgi:hypothetical protein